jgi:hypothetical protein
MNETAANRLPIAQRLFERVEHEGRLRRTRDSPADNPPGEDVDNESDIDEALPGRELSLILGDGLKDQAAAVWA